MLVGLSGGIGAGKSVIARCLTVRGYRVIDTDSLAKAIMDCNPEIKSKISSGISETCIVGGEIDRRALAEIVFSDGEKLRILNEIVHGAVKREIVRMAAEHRRELLFVESAIFYQSGLDRICEAEVRVTAPECLRIKRVMARNSLTESAVRARIESQRAEEQAADGHLIVFEIINDGSQSVLSQLDDVLKALSRMAANS